MTNTKPSDFTADSTPDDTDIIPYVDLDGGGAGVHLNKKITLNELTAYFENRARVNNASVANQGPGLSSDTYVTNSDILIPAGRLQAKSIYRCLFHVTKTGAGTAAPVVNVRVGTAGTTSDTSRSGALTLGAAGSAAADEAVIEVCATFRTVGSGTTAVMQFSVTSRKGATTTTGFHAQASAAAKATSGGFDSTVASLKIGVSYNGGTSASHTISLVQAELRNLA